MCYLFLPAASYGPLLLSSNVKVPATPCLCPLLPASYERYAVMLFDPCAAMVRLV